MAPEGMKEIKILIPEELFGLLFPAEALSHLRTAGKEVLLAARAVLEAKIAALERREAKSEKTARKKIKVE
jgi:hypothetical protein